jgi:hypothetical protein
MTKKRKASFPDDASTGQNLGLIITDISNSSQVA